MAETTSLAWPNMFDVARNRVSVYEDNTALVSRTRLLILSEPTSLYNSPEFGVGLARHLWQYNNENQKAIIKDRIVQNLRINEPYVIPDETQFANGLLFTGEVNNFSAQEYNQLKMTVALKTTYNTEISITLNDSDITYTSESLD